MLYSIIRQLFSGETFNAASLIAQVLVSVFVVFCVLPIHEFAHSLVAYKLGDNTPKYQGRLTINPLAHLDILGAIMIMLFGFGYAKPVGINPYNFKNRKRDSLLVALAGPFSNLLMAFFFMALLRLTYLANSTPILLQATQVFLYYAAYININLAIFNILPIPPLDGSKILAYIIPDRYYYKFLDYQRYIMIGIFLLISFGFLSKPLAILTNLI
ncbi:MAG: site-2 protease family protein, partial [Clostridiales bacterium]|nr:site-2 protease family protein [Clostridiales bacterium]